MDNLNKENFWNEAHAKWPLATQRFCDWIDRYKADHKWNELFNHQKGAYGNEFQYLTQAPKFHDLPWELQMGILMRFMVELPTGHPPKLLIYCFGDMEKAGIYFGQYLKELEDILNRLGQHST